MFDLHRSPVSRERIGLGATYLLQERYLPVPTNPVNGMAWACTVHSSRSNLRLTTGKI